MPEPLGKRYIGDGVYAAWTGHGIELTTEDGHAVTNRIVLEAEVWFALVAFVTRGAPEMSWNKAHLRRRVDAEENGGD